MEKTTPELDLFGQPISPTPENPRNRPKYRKHLAHHHPQNTHPPAEDEINTCRNCRYCIRTSPGSRYVHKCTLDITASAATDIRLKWTACRLFHPRFELLHQYITENEIPCAFWTGWTAAGEKIHLRINLGKTTAVHTEAEAIAWLRANA